MITVGELIKKLEEFNKDDYVSIGEGVLHSGLGDEFTTLLLYGSVKNTGLINIEEIGHTDEDLEYWANYDDTKNWIELE